MSSFDVQAFFRLGMKREMPELIAPVLGKRHALNLGAGNAPLPLATNLDFPEWDATSDPLPASADAVNTIFAFHFFEHLTGDDAIRVLRECERVLVPGGTLNVVVPHRLGSPAYESLDHKSFWTEETWKELFASTGYTKNRERPWRFRVHANFIMGLVERNLALFTQLEKE